LDRGRSMKSVPLFPRLLQATLALTILAVCPATSPAVMKALSTEELTKMSDTVVQGDVEDVQPMWDSTGKKIITRVTVRPTQTVTGTAQTAPVVVEYEGGEVGRVGMKVSDTPAMKKGENVLLFLKAGKSPVMGMSHAVIGRAQGKYNVGADGILRKGGFSVMGNRSSIDNNIPLQDMIRKVQGVPRP